MSDVICIRRVDIQILIESNLFWFKKKTNLIRILQYFIEFRNQRRIDMQMTLFLK